MKISDLLSRTRKTLEESSLPLREAELLLCRRLRLPRHRLYLEMEKEVPRDVVEALQTDLRRRLAGEPLQLILGTVCFYGLELEVRPGVFIPRPESEVLVERALTVADDATGPILDLCCGSGALTCALAAGLPRRFVVALDLDAAACELTASNARRLGLEESVAVLRGDLAECLRGPFGLVVCNPPYIARKSLAELPSEVRDYDPVSALDGGPAGLDYYRRLAPELPRLLAPGGRAFLEIGEEQGPAIREILSHVGGLDEIEIHPDLTGRERVATARHPA